MFKEAPRLLAVFAALICFAASTPDVRAQVVISEFTASKSNGVVDESGANEDWIEVANTSGAAVNLLGYYLTDDAGQLLRVRLRTPPEKR